MSPLPLRERTQGEKPTAFGRIQVQDQDIIPTSIRRVDDLRTFLGFPTNPETQSSHAPLEAYRKGAITSRSEGEGSYHLEEWKQVPHQGRGSKELPAFRLKYLTIPMADPGAESPHKEAIDYKGLYIETKAQLEVVLQQRDFLRSEIERLVSLESTESIGEAKSSLWEESFRRSQQLMDALIMERASLLRLLQMNQKPNDHALHESGIEGDHEVPAHALPNPHKEEEDFVELLTRTKLRWKDRADRGQLPIEFLRVQYGEHLEFFGAPKNRLFQDMLNKIDPELLRAVRSFLKVHGHKHPELPTAFATIVPTKAARISARIESGFEDHRTVAARLQRQYREKLKSMKKEV